MINKRSPLTNQHIVSSIQAINYPQLFGKRKYLNKVFFNLIIFKMRSQRTTPNLPPRFRQNLNPVIQHDELHIPQNHQGPLLVTYTARKSSRKRSISDQKQQDRPRVARPPKAQLPVYLHGKNGSGQPRGRNVQLEKQKFLMTSYRSPQVDFVKKLGEPKKDLQSVKKAQRARLKDKLLQIKSEWQGGEFTINVDSNLDLDANRNSNLLKAPGRNLFPSETTVTQFDNNRLNICPSTLEAQMVNSSEESGGDLEDRRVIAQNEYGQQRCGTPNNGILFTKGLLHFKEGIPSSVPQSWLTKPPSPRGGYLTTRMPKKVTLGGFSRNIGSSSLKSQQSCMKSGSLAKSGKITIDQRNMGRYHMCTQLSMRQHVSKKVGSQSKSSVSSIRSNNSRNFSRGPTSRGLISRGAIGRGGIISRNSLSKGTLAQGTILSKDLETYFLNKKSRKASQRYKKGRASAAKSNKAIPSPNLLWVESLNNNLKRQLQLEGKADAAHKNYLTCATHMTQTGMSQESPPQKRPFSQQRQELSSISPSTNSRNKSRNNTNIYAAPSKPLSELHKQITIHQERHLSNQAKPIETQPTMSSIQKAQASKLFQILTDQLGSQKKQAKREVKKQFKKSRNPSKENPSLNSVPAQLQLQLTGRQLKTPIITPKASNQGRGMTNKQGSQFLFQEQLLHSVKAPRVFTMSDKLISLKRIGQ